MTTSIYAFIQDHPWLTCGSIFTIIIVVRLIWRIIVQNIRIPADVKLSWQLHRAAKGMRKLGSAKRILSRCVTVYSVSPLRESSKLIGWLLKAYTNAGNCVDHVSEAQKKLSKLGASPAILAFLDLRIKEAKRIRETCNELRRDYTSNNTSPESKGEKQLIEPWNEIESLLDQTQYYLDGWQRELTHAENGISDTVNPIIMRSGGILRDPFKPESAMENAQSERVIELRESKEDLSRVEKCTENIKECISTLRTSENIEPTDRAIILGLTLDEIDNCLTGSKLPLPKSLVTGESPTEVESIEPNGLMQMIFDLLAQAEVSAWEAVTASC